MRLLLIPLLLVANHDDTKPVVKTATCELIATKHLVVNAKINGKGPFRLIFDTGSPVVLLNNKVAREAEIAKVARGLPKLKSNLSGQQLTRSIEIGGAVAENVPVTVFDHPTLSAITDIVGPIDGIVGYPFFGRFQTTIDYSALKLSFQPSGHVPEDVIQSMMNMMMDRSKKKGIKPLLPVAQLGVELEKPDKEPGVRIKSILPGGAAAKARFQPGDRLLTIDGRWTDSRDDCLAVLADLPEGKVVPVVVSRGGVKTTLEFVANTGF